MLSIEEHEKRLSLYNAGYNDCQIAKELNYSNSTITMWRKKNSLPSVPYKDFGRCYGKKKKYSVWDNRTDEMVCCNLDSQECERIMKIKKGDFHSIKYKIKIGASKRWTILECEEDGDNYGT